MRKLAVSASKAVPVRSTAVMACAIALFPSGSDPLESSCEDDDGTSSWDRRTR
jgi:hypothetical protein